MYFELKSIDAFHICGKVWHTGAMPSEFARGLRQNSAGNGHQTLEKKELRQEPIKALDETFSSNPELSLN